MIILSGITFSEEQKKEVNAQILYFNGGTGAEPGDLGPVDNDFSMCTEEQAGQVEGVICTCQALTPVFFETFPNIRWIQLMSVGYDNAPLDLIARRGILLTNARGNSAIPLAEDAVCKLMVLMKNIRFYMDNQKKHRWERGVSNKELTGRKALVLGAGVNGREIIRRLCALDMEVSAYDIMPVSDSSIHKLYMSREELLTNLCQFDCIVSVLPLTDLTANFIDGEFLNYVKQGAFFVNNGRGGNVDMEALCAALQTGKLGGAAVDVMTDEPIPEDSPFWDIENLFITPHQAYKGDRTLERSRAIALENIHRYAAGEPLKFLVDLEK